MAALEMHPLDIENRIEELRNAQGIGYARPRPWRLPSGEIPEREPQPAQKLAE